MDMKIIITEQQYRLLNEAVGVPPGIMLAAEELYNIIEKNLSTITDISDTYTFNENVDITISDIKINQLELTITTEKLLDDGYDPIIYSMIVSSDFRVEKPSLTVQYRPSDDLNLTVKFATNENWSDPKELHRSFTSNKPKTISTLVHEIKHKYDKQKKTRGKLIDRIDYKAVTTTDLNSGIPIINEFIHYSYFIHNVENLVRPTEVATLMTYSGITKEQFYEFIINNEVFTELKQIREFTFEHLINSLIDQMEYVDIFLKYINAPENLTIKEKIKTVFRTMFIAMSNARMDIFDNYTSSLEDALSAIFGIKTPNNSDVERKFINTINKYKNRETEFFKDECRRFNHVATKMMKKISKVYSLIPDDKEQTNESILDWDLHNKSLEKTYGKRVFQKEYRK
jgi:hypothetical protein